MNKAINMKYPYTEASPNFSKLEEEIIKHWQENDLFRKSIEQRSANGGVKRRVFYDGPPFANGLPHYGHILTGYIKDTYPRYWTMKGFRVDRRWGWDCHGLPAEMHAESELGVSGRQAITSYGIDKFNAHCRLSVMKYASIWEDYVTRQARWVDFKGAYKTMDKDFMESVLWTFKELHNKGYVYEDMRVVPYSWACQTPLSNFETRLDNSYRPKVDKAVTVSFVLTDVLIDPEVECRILAWTTTPWTLPSNLALMVNPSIEYVAMKRASMCYILAKSCITQYESELSGFEEYRTFKGRELCGLHYKPIFDYFIDHRNAFQVLPCETVVEGDGAGIVHSAPGFGEEDYRVCKEHGIDLVCPVDEAGKFTSEVSDLDGLLVFDANDKIIAKLKALGNWIKTEQYTHNYPHCWRTDTPLIYKAVPSWYIKVTAFRDRMVELNQNINWIPGHIKDGMFGNWLEKAHDWCVSRNRFWGTPIPVWKSDNPLYPRIDVYGGVEEIELDFGVKIEDLHRPFIDSLVRANPDDPSGESMMRRVPDVFDCWFESGAMPYAQTHYPFENKEWFKENFPADFIVEYEAQTRGWFYVLLVLSTALFDSHPFKSCICHGVILDSRGQKLSKRLNNYPDPMEIFAKYGSDALRFTMLSSSIVKGEDLLLDEKMIFDTLRLFIKPIWNAYHFFTMYANMYNIRGSIEFKAEHVLDRYILSLLHHSVDAIAKSLDAFDSQEACAIINNFFEMMNNWYIRCNRLRFWKQCDINAYNVLYTCLSVMCRAMAPLLPLVSEYIYRGLHPEEESVHMADYPYGGDVDHGLISRMQDAMDICNTALFVRHSNNVRIRQPLDTLIIAGFAEIDEFIDIIQDQVNVKQVKLERDVKAYADSKLQLNFPNIGRRMPHKTKDIIAASQREEWGILKDGNLSIAGVILEQSEFSLGLQPNADNVHLIPNNLGVLILDCNVTMELHLEGIARDIIRLVQKCRKEINLNILDKICLEIISTDKDIKEAVNSYRALIEEHTISVMKSIPEPKHIEEAEVCGHKIEIRIIKL